MYAPIVGSNPLGTRGVKAATADARRPLHVAAAFGRVEVRERARERWRGVSAAAIGRVTPCTAFA